MIVLGEAHLRRILKSYAHYCNGVRTHRSLAKMRRSLAKFSESEAANHTPSLADFATTTPELMFSVHTGTDLGQRHGNPSDKYPSNSVASAIYGLLT
jgi:hypothetical protein